MTWTHYRLLTQIAEKERSELKAQAARERWSAQDLKEKLRLRGITEI